MTLVNWLSPPEKIYAKYPDCIKHLDIKLKKEKVVEKKYAYTHKSLTFSNIRMRNNLLIIIPSRKALKDGQIWIHFLKSKIPYGKKYQ